MALLWALREQGPLRANALAEAVYSDPSTTSRHVAALVDQGLIRREPDPVDRRATLLAVTEAGQAVVAERLAVRDRVLGGIISDWEPADRVRFAELLDRFATGFAHQVNSHHTGHPGVSRPAPTATPLHPTPEHTSENS
jgi:DNA-binding MarR family transcriptional regulator